MLLVNRQTSSHERIAKIESDFFAHCIACKDLIAFTITWFKLGKKIGNLINAGQIAENI